MDGNKKAAQRATKAKVHLTTSFINSFKHDEIGVGHKINVRDLFFPVFWCVQQEFVLQNLVIWKTRSCCACVA
jgi:hypothetical protein